MGKRVRMLRKSLNMTLDTFGSRIGINKSSVSMIENGRNNLTERTILIICKEFGVNENWLRTGNGEMFLNKSRNQIISDFAKSLTSHSDWSFKKLLVESLAKLDENDWLVLEKLFSNIFLSER